MDGIAFNPATEAFSKWSVESNQNQYLYVSKSTDGLKIVKGSDVPDDKKGFCHYLGKLWRRNWNPSTEKKKVFKKMYVVGIHTIENGNFTASQKAQQYRQLANNLRTFKAEVIDVHNERRWSLFKFFHLAGFSDRTLDNLGDNIDACNAASEGLFISHINEINNRQYQLEAGEQNVAERIQAWREEFAAEREALPGALRGRVNEASFNDKMLDVSLAYNYTVDPKEDIDQQINKWTADFMQMHSDPFPEASQQSIDLFNKKMERIKNDADPKPLIKANLANILADLRAGKKCDTKTSFDPYFNMIRVDDYQTEETAAIQYHQHLNGHASQLSQNRIDELAQEYAVIVAHMAILQEIANELPDGDEKTGLQLVIDAQLLGVNPNASSCSLSYEEINATGGYQFFYGNGAAYQYVRKDFLDNYIGQNKTMHPFRNDPTIRFEENKDYTVIPEPVVEFFVRWNAWKPAQS